MTRRSALLCGAVAFLNLLLLCGLLSAQSVQSSPGRASSGPASQAVSLTAARDQPRNGAVEILSDTQGADFGPYLTDVVAKVRQSWYSLIPEDAKNKKGKVAIEFAIRKDGQVADLRLVAASGDSSLDSAALGGIRASVPFSALPGEFHGPYVALRFRFYYNPDKSEFDGSDSPPSAGSIPDVLVLHSQAFSEKPSDQTRSSNSSKPVLCVPENPQTRVGNAEILNDTHGTDLHPYLEASVFPLIRANWYRILSKSGEKIGGEATVQFTILSDGSVTAVKLVDGAGHATLGDLAINAIGKSGPFLALPSEFTGESLNLRIQFDYEPASTAFSKGDDSNWTLTRKKYSLICTPDEMTKGATNCLTPPHVTFSPEPEFTPEAKRNLTQGTVTLYVVVAADGTVQDACAAQRIGDGLEEKAVEAVRTWKFVPAKLNGKPSPVSIAVVVDFHLE